ncbi:MAG: phosphatidylinositol-specific phospholipase C domain-containing protein [Armatimonadetes bacterium]|nr:phosphatidylinositol-specific phospholipase C domain-containing protein [Armatimonadota bacterium]
MSRWTGHPAHLKVYLIGLLLFMVAVGDTWAHFPHAGKQHRFYNSSESIDTEHEDWMSWLPDTIRLTELSIPGTHDSGSFYGGDAVQTQSLRLPTQLKAGIRAWDIRCRHIEDRFAIHHGSIYQKAMFGDVLEQAAQFLRDHPRETILMRVKREYNDSDNTRTFAATFKWYRDQTTYGQYIWKPPTDGGWEASQQVPKLGDVRGKIVILQNFSGDLDGDGNADEVFGPVWGNSDIQDEWDLDTVWELDSKWNDVRDHLDKTSNGDPSRMYVNFLSASSENGGVYPYTVARGSSDHEKQFWGVNHHAIHYLVEANVKRTGLMMMDFPGAGLIDVIIAHNFRFATHIRSLQNDFRFFLKNIAYTNEKRGSSVGAEALAQHDELMTLLKHVLPTARWHLFVIEQEMGFARQTDGLLAYSDEIDSYITGAMTSRFGHSEVSVDELKGFVDGEIGSLSGSAQDRATQLAARVRARFPGQFWSVVIRKGDGGFDNWAYTTWGAKYRVDKDDYKYVVWGYARNDPPTAVAGGPYNGQEGSPITFNGGASHDPDGDRLQYRWDRDNDGVWDTDWSFSPIFRTFWLDDHQGMARLAVTDGEFTRFALANVTVSNVSPVVQALGDFTTDEGKPFTLSGTFTDPGSDTHVLTIDWGDGTVPTNLALSNTRRFEVMHTYVDDNPSGTAQDDYTIRITLTDDDGGVGTESSTVTVRDLPPQVTFDRVTDETGAVIGVDVPAALVGVKLTATGRFTDPGLADTHQAAIDWGDGAATLSAVTQGAGSGAISDRHVYDAPSTALLRITVTDDDTLSGQAQGSIQVLKPSRAIQSAVDLMLKPLLADSASGAATKKALQSIIGLLEGHNGGKAKNGAIDKLDKGNEHVGLKRVMEAVRELYALTSRDGGLSTEARAVLERVKAFLALTAKSVYLDALADAQTAARPNKSQRKISQATALGNRAGVKLAGEDYLGAVIDYHEAVRIL